MEFDYALKTNKTILALIHANPDELPLNKCETSTRKSAKLKKFYAKVSSGRLIKKWTNKDNLKSAALAALFEAKQSETNNNKGWIRAERVKVIPSEFTIKLSEAEKEKNELNKTIKTPASYERHLEEIIYKAYFDPTFLHNNEEVEELIDNMQYAFGFKLQHEV